MAHTESDCGFNDSALPMAVSQDGVKLAGFQKLPGL